MQIQRKDDKLTVLVAKILLNDILKAVYSANEHIKI